MIVGTRGSALAMAQTKMVMGMLAARDPDLEVEVLEVRTMGDRVTDRPLSTLGGYGAFTKELDQRILDGQIDVAVNSLKDMPVDLTPGTRMAAVLPRGPVEDMLLSKVPLEELPSGAVVGSSSVRRRSLLEAKRPDVMVRDLRGNVPTRIRKWKDGQYDAIVLAKAGLDRLGITEKGFVLNPQEFVPAPGQGAIALVCAEGSPHLHVLQALNDIRTRTEVEAERYILRALGGGCSVPIGVWASIHGSELRVVGTVTGRSRDNIVHVDQVVPLSDMRTELDRIADLLRPAVGG
ncbi:MAG: porphobilinogen deaminase [Methanomassiliicoccales archaeon PtaU1.Bin030]|nr:MAG: porphobilinogen deaminase [Methanomassiliicoccales archaeon PtaU1.Bin030]